MKRNLKPFSVEIKKPRTPGQRHHLPPKRLFQIAATEAAPVLETKEPQAVAEPAIARRILPSILTPVQSNPEPVAPVRRKRSSASVADPGQAELDLQAPAPEEVEAVSAEAPVISEALSQASGATVLEENASPSHEDQPQEILLPEAESTKVRSHKPRRKAFETAPAMASEPVSEAEVMQLWPQEMSRKASRQKLTKRQAATKQLPRSERWKRRLPQAAW